MRTILQISLILHLLPRLCTDYDSGGDCHGARFRKADLDGGFHTEFRLEFCKKNISRENLNLSCFCSDTKPTIFNCPWPYCLFEFLEQPSDTNFAKMYLEALVNDMDDVECYRHRQNLGNDVVVWKINSPSCNCVLASF